MSFVYKVYGSVLSTGTKERTIEVLGGYGHARLCVGVGVGVGVRYIQVLLFEAM